MENLLRHDLHPLHEAAGFRALLELEEPKYSIEQISAKTGKSPSYIRLLCGQPHKSLLCCVVAYVVSSVEDTVPASLSPPKTT
jgi:hypothetical protein